MEYIIKRKLYNYTIVVNSSHVILNFTKVELYYFLNPIIIIENNIFYVSIYIKEAQIFKI